MGLLRAPLVSVRDQIGLKMDQKGLKIGGLGVTLLPHLYLAQDFLMPPLLKHMNGYFGKNKTSSEKNVAQSTRAEITYLAQSLLAKR